MSTSDLDASICLLDNGYIYKKNLYSFEDTTTIVATLNDLVYDTDIMGYIGAIGNNILSFVPANKLYYWYQLQEDNTLTSMGSYAYGTGRGFLDGKQNNINVAPCLSPRINNSCIAFSQSTKADVFNVSVYVIDITKQVLKSLTVSDSKLFKTDDAVTEASDVLKGKRYYNQNGLQIGTMPNNGALTYTPSEQEQVIPAGYTSGGTVKAIDYSNTLTPAEYTTALDTANEILTGMAQDM